MHSCTKHMELDLFFDREKVMAKQLQVVHVLAIELGLNPHSKTFLKSVYRLNYIFLHSCS